MLFLCLFIGSKYNNSAFLNIHILKEGIYLSQNRKKVKIMSKTKYTVIQEFNNDTNITFEELLVKAINTYIANQENVTLDKGAIHFQDNQLKCT